MTDKPVQTLRIPGNPYEGAPVFSARSADGALYIIYAGVQPGSSVFAQQCAVLRDGKWSWLRVPQAWHARPSMTVEHDGLYMTYASSESTTVRWRVPGFVVPASGGGSGTGLSEQQVRDIAWALVPDAVYADLSARGGIYGHIRAIVDEAIKEQQQ
jgi:hypothetical protein